MTIKASAALIFAAGLLVGIAAPLPATAAGEDSTVTSKSENAEPAKSVRPAARPKKRISHRKSTPPAAKPEETRKADESKPAAGEKQVADASGGALPVAAASSMPLSVSGAYAQMTAADASSDSARSLSAAMSEKAGTMLLAASDKPADAADAQAEPGVVASDQLNDFDRGLQAAPIDQPMTQTVAIATVKPALAATSQAAGNDSSTLDKTSLIGKIFIAFGALLTVASAARMFMA